MPDFAIFDSNSFADQGDGSPAGCSLCGNIEGPFVIPGNTSYTVNTVNGVIAADKPLQFCAPKYSVDDPDTVLRQGCVGAMAGLAGYVGPEVLRGAQKSIADAHEIAAGLEEEIAKLRASQLNVVSVDDLKTLIAGAQPADAAGT